ncbi:hypothetical protein CCR75_001601 [Bremia lactucae]|uniref:HMG box domain-containing protein n=1 Tax=Bremia lactucae TaxID=4779 RepID=A0A976FHB6_BRELC|nr:hypothetical protein CCR75_001601 [Bremia lactucae]
MISSRSSDWRSAVERLALFMQRYAMPDERVAKQLGWSVEKLRTYLSPESRRLTTSSDIADIAVDKLLMRYRVALAHQTLTNATTRPLKPFTGSLRRSTMSMQFGRTFVDRKSIIRTDVTPAQMKEATEVLQTPIGNRKRKRRAIMQPLNALSPQVKITDKSDSTNDTKDMEIWRRPYRATEITRQMTTMELICPIRLDIDMDGVRYQDTFLINAALTTCSPEYLATQIAQDEELSDALKGAIAESIRRQIWTFTSLDTTLIMQCERLYPIYIDLIIEGYSLRDQFEWDLLNDYNATETFAAVLCNELKLPKGFEPAIVYSIYEQVAAYRVALSGYEWIGTVSGKENDTTSCVGYIEIMPCLDDVVRNHEDTQLWQPVLSELSTEEKNGLSASISATRAPTSIKQTSTRIESYDCSKRVRQRVAKDHRLPRPINPFIVFCQMQKEGLGRTRRSASETRKIMGDKWRKCSEEVKEYYSQLTEVENEKRRRDYILDVRDREIAEWEEDEARRKGLVASSTLEASTEHFRGLLLENYLGERHLVDLRKQERMGDSGEEDNSSEEIIDETDEM